MTGPNGGERHHPPHVQLLRALVGIAVTLTAGVACIAAIVGLMTHG